MSFSSDPGAGTSGDGGDALQRLPHFCKRAGKRKHLDIYRRLLRAFPSFAALNRLLGDLFPPPLKKYRRRLYLEVRLSRRVPDCVVVFLSPRGDEVEPPAKPKPPHAVCYVIEFKTTQSDADVQSVRRHATHSLQYAEGLRQLKGALVDFEFLRVPSGGASEIWSVVPSIVFFQRHAASPSFGRTFRAARFDLCTDAALDYLARRQDESVAHILAATHRRLRAPPGKRSAVPRPRTATPAGGRRGGDQGRLAGRLHHGSGAQAVSARGAARPQRQGTHLLRGSGGARVRSGGAAQSAVRGRRGTAAVPGESRRHSARTRSL
ncbi:nuclear protein UL24 [Panine betaherpesvirus 2]|uniref:Nuclear protein UL24 n=1 Tax=Panine betaherpesvirus 2 TaxID=188763 RepID=Q8QS23_9BETA|nr:nuclear protein UL24 [Panine betaherpesvirus 2]AAM00715.1 nuclear protein UL24 [Panine betaherpesvirus 2]QXV67825.1 nuclear protein UL24 [Panine betaherpesvirus 2]